MKTKKLVVVGVVAAVGLGGGLYALQLLKAEKERKRAVNPAPYDPGVNPNVNPDLPAVKVDTATGYRDVEHQQVTVDTMHLDNFWQYEGGRR
jgi:hypothetical protein